MISPNQSGFRPGDSCINQLIAITHEIYKSFDDGLEVMGVFLDISKAFDKVWHEGLFLKLSLNGISGNLLNLLRDFLYCCKQRVVLNGQNSSWENVNTGVLQRSILGPLLFLIYINDLPNGVSSNCKLFADDTSLFSVVNGIQSSASTLRNDLTVISNWAFQWKMIFNPDLTKQAPEVIFSRKTKKLLHPCRSFNDIPIKNSISQKHLALTLDVKLNFVEHIKNMTQKISKTIGLLRKFQPVLPRSSLLTIYKTFIRSQLDFADVIYDLAYNSSFHEKLESIQCSGCLAITGVIRGTSSEKLYQELGLESLKSRRWFRKLCHFYKILNEKSPSYLFDLIPNLNKFCDNNNIPETYKRHNYFKNSFLPSTLSEWNNLGSKIRNSGSLSIFKKTLLNFIRPCANCIFNIHNPYGIKLLTRLRLGLSHLRHHKFRYYFQETLNPLYDCGNDTETTTYFFLHCPSFHTLRRTLLNNIRNINEQILSHGENQLIQTFCMVMVTVT